MKPPEEQYWSEYWKREIDIIAKIRARREKQKKESKMIRIQGCVGVVMAGFGYLIGLDVISIFISIILMVILSTILARLLL